MVALAWPIVLVLNRSCVVIEMIARLFGIITGTAVSGVSPLNKQHLTTVLMAANYTQTYLTRACLSKYSIQVSTCLRDCLKAFFCNGATIHHHTF